MPQDAVSRFYQSFPKQTPSPPSPYRVVSTHKKDAQILDVNTRERLKAHLTRHLRPVCGDYVQLDKFQNDSVRVAEVLPRRNHFARSDRKGNAQIIAANIDLNVIVVAVRPEPTRDLINRYLVASHHCGIEPLLVFNKTDLDPTFFDETEKTYRDLGYQTCRLSAKQPESVQPLLHALKDKTSILVGQSGVGKSSLSRIILQDDSLRTGDLSQKTGKGSHVTSVTRLYPLPDSEGFLIDSPGVWEYGLWRMTPQEIAAGFIDFQPYLGQCKFNDCSHLHEPDCAIRQAVEKGEIDPKRYQSYTRIVESMKHHER